MIEKKKTTVREPYSSRLQKETDLKDAPITAVEFHSITAEHNSI